MLDFEYQTYKTALPSFPQVYEIGCTLNTGECYHRIISGVDVGKEDTALTGITPEIIQGGVFVDAAFEGLLKFFRGLPVFIWGFSDVTLLSMTLWENRVPFPHNMFYEARSYLEGLSGIKLPRGLSDACKHLHLMRKDKHGALVDAHDTLRVITAVAGIKEAQPIEVPFEIFEV